MAQNKKSKDFQNNSKKFIEEEFKAEFGTDISGVEIDRTTELRQDFALGNADLSMLLDKWRDETGDSDPGNISEDSFDRETGDRIVKGEGYRGTTPGEDRNADRINAPGPR